MPPPPRPARPRPAQRALGLPGTDSPLVLGEIEDLCRAEGFWPVCGTDEAGRGPLAGPVVAAAVVLHDGAELPGLDDSKALTEKQREALVPQIHAAARAFAVVAATEAEIEQRNILGASLWAMRKAVDQVWKVVQADGGALPRILLIDGNLPVPGIARLKQRPVIKGDARSRAIAAASVLAKVHRDHHMVEQDHQFPGYGFADHKGYPTPQHFEALRRLGPCPIHRRGFAPVAQLLAPRTENLKLL